MIQLPDYIPSKQRQSLNTLCHYFLEYNIHGLYANGSIATGTMDEHSDLDLAVSFNDEQVLAACWKNRRKWKLPFIHQYEADHRKPNLVVLILENGVKADIFLTQPGKIRPFEKPPFLLLHDPSGELAIELDYSWTKSYPSQALVESCLEEDKKFWGWLVFDHNHIQRGDYYLLADDFYTFRKMLQNWLGIWAEGKVLTGREFMDHPELKSWQNRFAEDLFPPPEPQMQWKAHCQLIRYALEIRQLLSARYPEFIWLVTEEMKAEVRRRWLDRA